MFIAVLLIAVKSRREPTDEVKGNSETGMLIMGWGLGREFREPLLIDIDFPFWSDRQILHLVVMIAQPSEYAENHRTWKGKRFNYGPIYKAHMDYIQ